MGKWRTGRTNPATAIRPVAFPYLAPELWHLVFLCTHIIRRSISDIYTRIITLTQTSSMSLHGINSIHISLEPSVPNPAHSIVSVWGDDRGERRVVACTAVSCGREWDGGGEHRGYGFIHAMEKLWWCRRMLGWRGGECVVWGASDSRGDGRGECKVDVDKDEDVEGYGSAHGLVADVVELCETNGC